MSVQVSYKKQFALGIILLLIFVFALEGFSKVYEFFNPRCSFIDDPKDALANIDFFTLRMVCNDTSLVAHIKSDILLIAPDQHFGTININSHGFRGPEFLQDKPFDTYRIFVVGGSTTYGVGSTSDKTTIPGYLQQKFDNSNMDVNVEVINAGIGGADSTSEVYLIKNIIWDFHPDLIVVFDGINDAQHNPYELSVDDNKEKNNDRIAFANFPFYRTPYVIYDILFREKIDTIHNEIDESLIDERITHWEKNWIKSCSENKEKGISTLLVVQPMLGSGNRSFSPDESKMVQYTNTQLQSISGFTNSLNTLNQFCDYTADLTNIFDNVSEPLYFDLYHLSDFGNEIVANKLFELTYPIVRQNNNQN